MEFRKHTLDNGLQIVAECSDKAYSMAMGFFVNTGSRDEVAEVAGVSHFLEHMVFKGTPTRSAAEVNRELDEIGSQSNAYTSEEHTVYYAAVLPDYQEQVLDLLSDIMRPSLRKEDFDTEKKVILEEIQKYDDQPPYGAHEKCMASYFGDHPLGQSVLGTLDSVGALKRDAMMDYFERRYSPGNMTLVASGNVDFEGLIKAAEQRCGKWQQYEVSRDTRRAAGSDDIVHYIEQAASSLEYVVQISGGPDAGDESRYARRLMSVIFGDEGGSRLFWDLVDSGLAEYAVTGTYEYQGSGITMAFMSCDPEDAEDNRKRLQELQEEIEEDGVEPEELELARSKVCSQIVRRAERPANRLFSVGSGWLQRGSYLPVRDAVTAYKSVTAEDIAASLKQYPMSKGATVMAGPLKGK